VDIGVTTRVSVQVDHVPADMRPPLAAVHLKESGQTFVQEMELLESLTGDQSMVDLIADFELPLQTREVLVVIEPFHS
jgi:hypothetical protein